MTSARRTQCVPALLGIAALAGVALIAPAGPAWAARAFTKAPRPTVIGIARVGSTVTASPGTWRPKPTRLSYHWYLGSRVVKGATGKKWTLPARAAGKRLRVKVTATRSGYTKTTRASTAKTVAPGMLTAPTPTIAGQVVVGSTLSANPGAWGPSPVTLSYQWTVDGAAVTGATGKTWALPADAYGKPVAVTVTGTKAGYTTVHRTSASATVGAASAPTASVAPTITGTPQVGRQLAASAGTWSTDGLTFAYQWLRGGQVIPGATSASYPVGPDDLGQALSVQVTAAATGYTSGSATSAPTEVVIPGSASGASHLPTFGATGAWQGCGPQPSGPFVGQTVFVTSTGWEPSDPFTYTYQWLSYGDPIAGATGASYVLSAVDLEAGLALQVTAHRPGYLDAVATSNPKLVAAGCFTSTSPPTIAGPSTPTPGDMLTAVPGTYSIDGVWFTYQWRRDGFPITGATSATFTVPSTLVGSRLSVVVTGRKPGYQDVQSSSSATAPVAAAG